MKGVISRLLFGLLLLSFASESGVYLMTTHDSFYIHVDMEDSENKSEESKTEKEEGKDKLSFQPDLALLYQLSASVYSRNNGVITAAYLSLPEIPPDRA